MKPTREQLYQWDRRHVWHAFTQMKEYEPLIVERAEGVWLYDMDGRKLLDGVSSLWCNVHGHRHPVIDAAIRKQLDCVAHVTSLGMSNPTTIQLARRLVEITPEGLNHVFFSDSGATAIEVALKTAFQYWRQCDHPQPEKTSYAALDLAYHGDTLGSNSVGGIAHFHELFRPLLFPVHRIPAPDTFRITPGVNPEDACAHYLSKVEEVLREHHREIAALVVEPIMQGAAGMLAHPPGYLRGVRDLTRQYNVLLIADEVAVGFGRTGTMFACEQEHVAPDLLCLAKGITAGYLPVAATLTTTPIWEAFYDDYAELKTLFHGHTYGGNPLGAAAALASLDVFEQEETLSRLPEKIDYVSRRLDPLRAHPHVGDIRQRGLMVGIELVQDKSLKQPYPWQQQTGRRVCEAARDHGVALRPLRDVIVWMPPLCVTTEQIDLLYDATDGAIRQVCGPAY